MDSSPVQPNTNPVLTIAKSRIEKEYRKIEKVIRSFPLSSWISFPAIIAAAVIISAGVLSYALFNPAELTTMTLIFLIANISIYLFLFMIALWFQLSFMRPRIMIMKKRFFKFKESNDMIKEGEIKAIIAHMKNNQEKYIKDDAYFPFVYLNSIFSEWGNPDIQKTRMIYELFKQEEEERVSDFIDGSRRFLLWVVRIGIIGTFLGLMTAFVFLGGGLSNIFSNPDINFKQAVSLLMEQSLFGYAAAVLSSLAANVASIFYEFFTLRKMQRFNLAGWMDSVFQWYVLSSSYKAEGLVEEFKNLVLSLQNVSQGVKRKVVEVDEVLRSSNFYKDFPVVLTSMSESMKTINTMANAIAGAMGSDGKKESTGPEK